jgi:hypothetical protein
VTRHAYLALLAAVRSADAPGGPSTSFADRRIQPYERTPLAGGAVHFHWRPYIVRPRAGPRAHS